MQAWAADGLRTCSALQQVSTLPLQADKCCLALCQVTHHESWSWWARLPAKRTSVTLRIPPALSQRKKALHLMNV